MARIGNSGIAHTCSSIDTVIGEIKSAIRDCDWSIVNENTEGCNDAMKSLEGLEDIMEDIRKANSGLRDYGDEQYQRVEKLENEVSDLESEISELKSKIEDLESVIKDLEQEQNNY